MKNKQALYKLLAILLVAAVTVGSLANLSAVPVTIDYNDKLVHFAAYFAISLSLYLAWRRVIFAFGFALFLGAILEIIQSQTGYRYFEWLDLAANTLGSVLGVASALVLKRVRNTGTA